MKGNDIASLFGQEGYEGLEVEEAVAEMPEEEVVEDVQEEVTEEPEEVGEPEDVEAFEMSDERFQELSAKAEEGTLTEEEINELKEAGHEVEGPDPLDEIKARLDAGENVDASELTEEQQKALEEEGYEFEEEAEPLVLEDVEKEVLASLNEELDFDDPKAVREAQINAMTQFSEIINNFQSAVDANPEAQDFLQRMLSKGDDFNFMTEIAIMLGSDDLAPQPGEEGYKEYMEAKVKQEFEQKQQKEKQKQRKNNLQASQQRVREYFQKNEVPQDRQLEVTRAMNDFVIAFNEGNVDKYLDAIYKGLFYDTDIKNESRKAEIKARNGQYVIKRKEVKKPQVKSSNVESKDLSPEENYVKSIFGG